MSIVKLLPSFVRKALAAAIEAELGGITADQVEAFKAQVVARVHKLLKV